jgi:hypothetical protein
MHHSDRAIQSSHSLSSLDTDSEVHWMYFRILYYVLSCIGRDCALDWSLCGQPNTWKIRVFKIMNYNAPKDLNR